MSGRLDPADRPGPTRGRAAELAAADEAVAAVRRGAGGVLAVEGPPGIGKSRLLAEIRGRARRAGVRTAAGPALEGQQAYPFAALLTALAEGGVLAEASFDSPERFLREAALALEAAGEPLVILIDDLHHAHRETLAGLRRLVPCPGVLWVFAATPGGAAPLVAETVAWLETSGARRLRLDALDEPAAADVLADTAGCRPGPDVLALGHEAGGNPGLLVALGAGVREEGLTATAGAGVTAAGNRLPTRVTQLVERRVKRLSPATQRMIRVAAVLPRLFSVAHWAATLGQRSSELIETVAEAFEADLLVEHGDQVRFRHALVRRALVDATPRSLRRAVQREVTGVLLEAGAAPTEIALQLADSAEVGDREAVALVRQAVEAIAVSDTQSAAELSVRALRLLPDHDPQRWSLVTDAVHLLYRAGRDVEARDVGLDALKGALPPAQEAEVRLRVTSMPTRPTGDRLRQNVLALELPNLPAVLRARHQAWLAYNLATSGRPAEAEKRAAGVDLCDDLHARVVTELALTAVDTAHGRITAALKRVEAAAEQVRGAPYESWQEMVPFHHADVLATAGRVADARGVLRTAVSRARHVSADVFVGAWQQFGGLLSLTAGRLCEVREEFAAIAGEREGEVIGDFDDIVRFSVWTALYAHQGDAEFARRAVGGARRMAGGVSPNVRRLARRVLAERELRRGDPVRALRFFGDDPLPATPPLLPHEFGYHVAVVRTALAAGDLTAAEWAAEAVTVPYRENPGIRVYEGVAAQVAGLLAGDPQVLADAARLLGDTERPLLFAAAAEDTGRLLGELDERAALGHLGTAFDTYLELDAVADARRLGRALAEKGARRRVITRDRPESGWASLTSAELKVVRLIAEGATNREAAASLVLSPHTVNSHLRNAFAKLGINSRRELAKIVHEADA
ncbi:LuxR C-terminal-related transcriptional regulator [Amycolatopsis sp. NPDC051903]|uniref:helix-turn-helix transcriptional regulator n=1 Tax=Amycolatopsis sp. NPDC051903 TaxID=3363936 RepID=UPI00379515ED